VYRKIIPESEEVRIATGYFHLSGFDLYKDDLTNLADTDSREQAPMRILMGRKTEDGLVELRECDGETVVGLGA
jgi:hypothetical protein